MRHKTSLLTAMAFLVLSLAGCTTVREYADIARSRDLSPEYRSALAEWTREQTVYSEFATRAKMVATFRSREFMEAYRAEYARVFQPGDEELPTTRAGESAGDLVEFLLYVYVPDRDAIDLDRRDSAWRAFMFTSGGELLEPVEIRELRNVGPRITEFYPYVNPAYGKIYLLKFDAPPGQTGVTELPVRLVVTGVIARIELLWE